MNDCLNNKPGLMSYYDGSGFLLGGRVVHCYYGQMLALDRVGKSMYNTIWEKIELSATLRC